MKLSLNKNTKDAQNSETHTCPHRIPLKAIAGFISDVPKMVTTEKTPATMLKQVDSSGRHLIDMEAQTPVTSIHKRNPKKRHQFGC